MLKILKSIRNSFLILILLASNGIAKEITNLSWKKSVYVGKELSNFRDTVTSPALGKGKHYSKFGIYYSWVSRWVDKVHGEYPTQVIYYDNLFRASSKEKLDKLIEKAN